MPRYSSTRITKTLIDTSKPGQCLSDCEVQGFRLIVSPVGTRRFVYQYRLPNGKRSTIRLGVYPNLTVEQARKMAVEQKNLVVDGIDPAKEKRDRRNSPRINDLFHVYVDDYAPSQNLSDQTVRDIRSVLKPALKRIGNEPVTDVNITDIRKLHGDERAAGIKRGSKGVYRANRMLAALSKMFSLGIERGWINNNPCKGVRKFPEEQRWRNLSEDEVGRLFAACQSYLETRPDDSLAQGAVDAIKLLLFTGARLQELLKAEWSQFDLERGFWEKPSAHTKTSRQHWLELEGPALDLLQEMKERAAHPQFLFAGKPRYGGNVVGDVKPRVDLKKPWAAIKKMADLGDVRLHDLRRTNASFMLSLGASLATVGKQLGHTQASTTQRYAHLAPSVQRDASRKVGEKIAALTKVSPEEGVVEIMK